MDKFDVVTSYTQKLLDGYDNKSEAGMSENSNGSTMRSNIAVQDMFGNEEVTKFSSNPKKGKKYLIFTIFMVVVLSFVVVNSAHKGTLISDLKKHKKGEVPSIITDISKKIDDAIKKGDKKSEEKKTTTTTDSKDQSSTTTKDTK